jgi:hypothetical protein
MEIKRGGIQSYSRGGGGEGGAPENLYDTQISYKLLTTNEMAAQSVKRRTRWPVFVFGQGQETISDFRAFRPALGSTQLLPNEYRRLFDWE